MNACLIDIDDFSVADKCTACNIMILKLYGTDSSWSSDEEFDPACRRETDPVVRSRTLLNDVSAEQQCAGDVDECHGIRDDHSPKDGSS